MTNNKSDLLRDAFIEAIDRKYKREISLCDEIPKYSKEHKERIRKIINARHAEKSNRRITKKTVVALLVAAVLLVLAGCATYTYRKQIGNFFMEVFDEHIEGGFYNEEGSVPTDIEEYYTLTYIPEGYGFKGEDVCEKSAMYKWENESGDILSFSQKVLNKASHYIDTEHSEVEALQYGEYTVHAITSSSGQTFLWDNGEYVFVICSTHVLPEEEVTKLITSLSVK